jgi:hypothetical protein
MGKGIALMINGIFPDSSREYAGACWAGRVKAGSVFVTEPSSPTSPQPQRGEGPG